MTEFLSTLIEYLWVADFIVFVVLGFLAYRQRQYSSSFITQSVVIIVSGTIIQYERLFFPLAAPSDSRSAFVFWFLAFALFDSALIYVLHRSFHFFRSKVRSTIASSAFGLTSTAFTLVTLFGQFSTLFQGDKGMSYKIWGLLAFHLGFCLLYSLAIFIIMKAHEVANRHHMLIARTYILAFVAASAIQLLLLNERFFFETNYLAGLYQWGLSGINIGTTMVALGVTCLGVWQYLSKSQKQGLIWTL